MKNVMKSGQILNINLLSIGLILDSKLGLIYMKALLSKFYVPKLFAIRMTNVKMGKQKIVSKEEINVYVHYFSFENQQSRVNAAQ